MTTPNQVSEIIKDEKFQDLISEINETLLDNFLDDGILKDIPIFGWIIKGKNLVSSVQDKLFSKKLLMFLYQLQNIPNEKRIEQIQKIDENKKYQIKVGEKILYLISQAEDSVKSKYLGILFSSFLREEIEYEDFLKATFCINNTNQVELEKFISNESLIFTEAPMYYAEDYLTTGLMTININDPRRDQDGELKINLRVTKTGKLIREILGSKRNQKLQ